MYINLNLSEIVGIKIISFCQFVPLKNLNPLYNIYTTALLTADCPEQIYLSKG